ncbi:hypothetical protein DFH07DRAFT_955880 [Mycena maculata]|uniref:Uncharacterized protein n=1 Tax=Mycena maculata TaxID=230809 RepID=A0AAD7NK29_9AGAR|nr:hypothetical protein DFH07DRAFT_955880 [Mycena maculata]
MDAQCGLEVLVAPIIWAIPRLLRSDGLDALYDKLPDKKGKDKQHSNNFHRLFEPEDYPCNQIQELGDGVYLFKKLTFKDGLLFYTTGPPSFRHYTQLSVEPTQDELDLFSKHPNVIFYVPRPITPMSHMVVVGDRVASWSQNFQGWIQKIEVVIEDCDGQQVEVRYAHVQQLGDKPPKLVRSGSLGLHMLSLPGRICLNDRVCASGGERGYWNKLGRVIQINEARGLLKIVDYNQLIADGGDKTHTLRAQKALRWSLGAGRNEDRWRSTSSILQQAHVDQKDGQTYDRIKADRLMRIAMGTGNALQNREVYVDGGVHLVKGEYGLALDFNATRSLPKNMDRRALLLEALSSRASVYEGAMVRVRLECSNQIVNVPIERLFDRNTILHQPWAAGEEVISKLMPELVRGPGRALTPPPGPVQPTSAEGDDADITLPGKSWIP